MAEAKVAAEAAMLAAQAAVASAEAAMAALNAIEEEAKEVAAPEETYYGPFGVVGLVCTELYRMVMTPVWYLGAAEQMVFEAIGSELTTLVFAVMIFGLVYITVLWRKIHNDTLAERAAAKDQPLLPGSFTSSPKKPKAAGVDANGAPAKGGASTATHPNGGAADKKGPASKKKDDRPSPTSTTTFHTLSEPSAIGGAPAAASSARPRPRLMQWLGQEERAVIEAAMAGEMDGDEGDSTVDPPLGQSGAAAEASKRKKKKKAAKARD